MSNANDQLIAELRVVLTSQRYSPVKRLGPKLCAMAVA